MTNNRDTLPIQLASMTMANRMRKMRAIDEEKNVLSREIQLIWNQKSAPWWTSRKRTFFGSSQREMAIRTKATKAIGNWKSILNRSRKCDDQQKYARLCSLRKPSARSIPRFTDTEKRRNHNKFAISCPPDNCCMIITQDLDHRPGREPFIANLLRFPVRKKTGNDDANELT